MANFFQNLAFEFSFLKTIKVFTIGKQTQIENIEAIINHNANSVNIYITNYQELATHTIYRATCTGILYLFQKLIQCFSKIRCRLPNTIQNITVIETTTVKPK